MPKILVPPEVLIRVSEEAARAAEELETTKNRLDQQITYMMSSWEGTTRLRFFEDFQHAHGEMNKTIEHLRIIGQELKAIAFRFISADMQEDLMIAAAAASAANESKTFWDHAGDFWQGLQTGARSVANSVKDTATSLVEDPLGTAKDMAYNATIGTAEEIIDTAVWGGKMIFNADTREKFAADIEDLGGASNYMGQQAAMILAGLATRRIGVKTHPHLKHDSGGDGGKVVEGKGKLKQDMLHSPYSEKWGVLEDGTNQGLKHFADYWEKYPDRIPSLAKRLGVDEAQFEYSTKGFENFTTQVERVIDKGHLREVNGKQIYYLDGAENPKKGVVVIVKDGKIQSMMPSDPKSFGKLQ